MLAIKIECSLETSTLLAPVRMSVLGGFQELPMKILTRVALAAVLMFATAGANAAFAAALAPVPVKPIAVGGGGGAGGAAAGGVIGAALFLVVYDLIRRTSCSGDFLGLGGPGFTEAITPGQNVLPPRKCVPVRKASRTKPARKVISVKY